jgi:hypothetical protein
MLFTEEFSNCNLHHKQCHVCYNCTSYRILTSWAEIYDLDINFTLWEYIKYIINYKYIEIS